MAGFGFFPSSVSICEDELFNIRILCKDIKVFYLSRALYHYNIGNNNSICHSYSTKVILSKKVVIAECEKLVDKNDFNDMYDMKRAVLVHLFTTKNLEELRTTYPEIHEKIIKSNIRYHFFTPTGYFLTKALKGNPYIYFHLYYANIKCIKIYQSLKKLMIHICTDKHV